jgi:NADPH:quinone reductase-like Zn-dependent oxidoreductase
MKELYREFLLSLVTLVATGIGTFLIQLISAKIKAIINTTEDTKKQRFLTWVNDELIVKCINTTTQTFVEELKSSNSFDKASQEKAMQKTVDAVITLLTDTNKQLLEEYVGDTNAWITMCVENFIQKSKK